MTGPALKVQLSAALIVRDEERHLKDCLRSVRPLVDEIVVGDTGSLDRTREIARAGGASVHEIGWRDDFAAARNAVLDMCHGEWILYVDADERVRPGAVAETRERLAESSLAGCYVWLRPASGHTAYREMRLFRNDPRVRFEGVIHENIWPALERYMLAESASVAHTELTLDHLGYEGDQTPKRHRDLPLLLKRLEKDPEHVYTWWHLGVVCKGLGYVERAREAWQSGAAAARRAGRRWTDALVFIGLIEIDFDAPEVSDPLLEEAMRRYPDHPHLMWLQARAMMRDDRFADAIDVWRTLLAWQSTDRASDGAVAVDERLFGVLAYEGLATCHFGLGLYREAERHFALAEQCAPSQEYKIKRQLCTLRTKQIDGLRDRRSRRSTSRRGSRV